MSNKRVPKRRFKQFKDDGEWEKKTLGDLGVFSSNGVNKKINMKENPAFLLNYMDIYNRRHITNENKKELMFTTATQTQILNNNVLKDDVFFTPSSETADDIGRVMVIEEDLENVVYSYHLTRFRPNENVFDTTFPNYLFESKKFRNQMILSAQGVQRFVLNRKNFEELNAYVPPVKEQKTLNDFFTKLDKMIELQEDKVNKLKDLKKSYLTDMFVGGGEE